MSSSQEIIQEVERKFNRKNKSYMMVTLLSMLEGEVEDGTSPLDQVADAFQNFYRTWQENGKVPESEDSPMRNPSETSISQVKSLLLEHPLKALEEFITYDQENNQLKFKGQLHEALDKDMEIELRKLIFRHLHDYYTKKLRSETLYITLRDMDNLPYYFAVTATDIARLSGHNQQKGIHPIDENGFKTVVVLCTLGGENYPNQWLDEEKTVLKYYLEGRTNAEGEKVYNEQSQTNQAVIRSRQEGYPVHVFMREKRGGLFYYTGDFLFRDVVEDEHGHKYFELVRSDKEADQVGIPDVSKEKILEAMKEFDLNKRNQPEWEGWEDKKTQVYAILHNGQKYPPKEIIRMATGARGFSGGEQSNNYLQKRGFDIINLRSPNTAPAQTSDSTENLPINWKEIIEEVYQNITRKGFVYDYEFIANFFLSLKTKPFVILAGISGTGKSQLVEQFANAVGATGKNGRFSLISVKPNWSDSSDLLGYRNLQGEFVKGPLTRVIEAAKKDPDYPYFVCLDEMNLARVEYYFSDFLSIIESRKKQGERIESNQLYSDGLEEGTTYPDNLYVIGTVNMDETTHSFSRKVLDRANTIEFSEVHLERLPVPGNNEKESGQRVENKSLVLENRWLKSSYLTLKDCVEGNEDYLREKIQVLQELNQILQAYSLHVGYRVRDEFSFYLLYNREMGLIDENAAIDFQILQKILPRIQGSSNEIETLLVRLSEYCGEKYPRSRAKVEFMLRRLEDDGFTSYWL